MSAIALTSTSDTIFGLIIAVLLIYIFLYKICCKMILTNPLYIPILIIALIALYMLWKVFEVVTGFPGWVDNTIQSAAEALK